jgi:hypothetical protein
MEEKNQLQNLLEEWANKTAAAYDKLAREEDSCNRSFYSQSDLTKLNKSPELLILGINPADKYNCEYDHPIDADGYKGQIQNENWSIPNGMTGERLLKGNPFEQNKSKWKIWAPIEKLFNMSGLSYMLKEGCYAYSNIILYATKEARDIPSKALELLPYTFKLIDAISPRFIMCLGKDSDKVVNRFRKNIVDIKYVIPNEMWIGKYNQSTVIGLSHPSRGAWSKHYEEFSQALREIIE